MQKLLNKSTVNNNLLREHNEILGEIRDCMRELVDCLKDRPVVFIQQPE